jgi:hypothetical protein
MKLPSRLLASAVPAGFQPFIPPQTVPKTASVSSMHLATDLKGLCDAGSFGVGGLAPCIACDFNHFQNTPGSASCMSCPAETFTIGTASTSASDCKGNSWPRLCPHTVVAQCRRGFKSATGLEPCEPAPVGQFCDGVGLTSCTDCPALTTTLTTGAASPSECIGGAASRPDLTQQGSALRVASRPPE